jgi:hypothetical protein
MGLSIGSVWALVHELPGWASYYYRGRNTRRLLQLFRKTATHAEALWLFESVAKEFESGEHNWAKLAKLAKRSAELIDAFETPTERGLLSQLHDVCVDRSTSNIGLCVTLLPEAAIARVTPAAMKRDEQLLLRTVRFEVKGLLKAKDAKEARAFTSLMDSLWPKGELACLKSTWLSTAAQRERRTRVMQDDAPTPVRRAAPISHLSDDVGLALHDAFGAERFNLVFSAGFEAWPRDEETDGLIYSRKNVSRSFTLPGRHSFRRPPDRTQYRAVFGSVLGDERFQSLCDFYKHHDGALLFQCEEADPADCLASIYGLEDQSAAREELRYWLDQRRVDEPNYHLQRLQKYDAPLDRMMVVVGSGSYFLIPLTGRYASKMIRFYIKVNRDGVWSSCFASGMKRLREEIVRVSLGFPLSMKMGDEENGGETMLALRKVKYERVK